MEITSEDKIKIKFNYTDSCSFKKCKPTNAELSYKVLLYILLMANNKVEIINNCALNELFRKYQKKYKNFEFLGAVPLDFYKISYCHISDIDFKSYIDKGKYIFFIIINMDCLYHTGSYWTSLYFNFKKNQIYFNDPFYRETYKNIYIKNYIKVIKLKMSEYNHPRKLDFKLNNIKYSSYF